MVMRHGPDLRRPAGRRISSDRRNPASHDAVHRQAPGRVRASVADGPCLRPASRTDRGCRFATRDAASWRNAFSGTSFFGQGLPREKLPGPTQHAGDSCLSPRPFPSRLRQPAAGFAPALGPLGMIWCRNDSFSPKYSFSRAAARIRFTNGKRLDSLAADVLFQEGPSIDAATVSGFGMSPTTSQLLPELHRSINEPAWQFVVREDAPP